MLGACKHYPTAALQAQYGGKCPPKIHHHPMVPHSNLPFTGSDIKLFLIAAVILIVLGLVLRFTGRNDNSSAA